MTPRSGGHQAAKKPQAQKQTTAPKTGYVDLLYLYLYYSGLNGTEIGRRKRKLR